VRESEFLFKLPVKASPSSFPAHVFAIQNDPIAHFNVEAFTIGHAAGHENHDPTRLEHRVMWEREKTENSQMIATDLRL
jgi:hypothetical protein